MSETTSLDALGVRHGTDKSSRGHGYLALYEPFFAPLRHRSLRILEIGVLNGASLRLWKEYFPAATIVGADNNPARASLAEARIAIEILDQSKPAQLLALANRHGPFDIVVEDGSHKWEHQIITLRALLPCVTPGGFYIVEDLQTNFGDLAERYRGGAALSCVDYLKRLVDRRVGYLQADGVWMEDEFLVTHAPATEFILFAKHCAILKRSATPGRHVTAPVLSRPGLRPPGFALLVHIGRVGDVRAATASAGLPERGRIQGFQVIAPPAHPFAAHLLARGRGPDGSWTGWVPAEQFVGTRGQRQELTGYAFRLADGAPSPVPLKLVGTFRHQPAPTIVDLGADCVPERGLAPLETMQILLADGA